MSSSVNRLVRMYTISRGEFAVLISNWLSTYAAQLKNSRRRDSRKPSTVGKSNVLAIQKMEDRTLLSATGLTVLELSAETPILNTAVSSNSSNVTSTPANSANADHFVDGGRIVSLIRADNEILFSFDTTVLAPASALSAIAGDSTSPGRGVFNARSGLALASSHELIGSRSASLQFNSSVDARAALSTLKSQNDIEWAGEKYFVAGQDDFVVITDEVLVTLEPGVDPDSVFEGRVEKYQKLRGSNDLYVVTIADADGSETLKAARELKALPLVRLASPNFLQELIATAAPNDTLYTNQWHLNNTGTGNQVAGADANLEDAWDTETGSDDIVVAVFDTGIDILHTDLNIFVNVDEIAGDGMDNDGNGFIDDINGWNFTTDTPNPTVAATGNGNHGTSVAGVLGAIGNNGSGVTGAAQHVQILPIKLLTSP